MGEYNKQMRESNKFHERSEEGAEEEEEVSIIEVEGRKRISFSFAEALLNKETYVEEPVNTSFLDVLQQCERRLDYETDSYHLYSEEENSIQEWCKGGARRSGRNVKEQACSNEDLTNLRTTKDDEFSVALPHDQAYLLIDCAPPPSHSFRLLQTEEEVLRHKTSKGALNIAYSKPLLDLESKSILDIHSKPILDTHFKPILDTHFKPISETHSKPILDTHSKPLLDSPHSKPLIENSSQCKQPIQTNIVIQSKKKSLCDFIKLQEVNSKIKSPKASRITKVKSTFEAKHPIVKEQQTNLFQKYKSKSPTLIKSPDVKENVEKKKKAKLRPPTAIKSEKSSSVNKQLYCKREHQNQNEAESKLFANQFYEEDYSEDQQPLQERIMYLSSKNHKKCMKKKQQKKIIFTKSGKET